MRKSEKSNRSVENKEEFLFSTIAMLENADECKAFLRDLCTPVEIKALSDRWAACFLLEMGTSYTQVHAQTGASITTIGRVARFLKNSAHGGYRIALDKIHQLNTKGKFW